MKKRVGFFLLFGVFSPLLAHATLPGKKLFFQPEGSTKELFLNPFEKRKKVLEYVQAHLGEYQKETMEGIASFDKLLSGINDEIAKAEETLKNSPKDSQFFSQKLVKLQERKAQFSSIKEVWTSGIDTLQKHHAVATKLVEKEAQDSKRKFPIQQKLVYSPVDFRGVQNKIAALKQKISIERDKRDSLSREKQSEDDALVSLQKKLVARQSEYKKILDGGADETEVAENLLSVKQQSALFEIENGILTDRKLLIRAKKKVAGFAVDYHNDHLKLLERDLEDLKKMESVIRDRLYVDREKDVDTAREELEREKQKALDRKSALDASVAQRQQSKAALKGKLETLSREQDDVRRHGAGDSAAGRLLDARRQELEANLSFVETQLDLYAVRKALEDGKIQLKEAQHSVVEVLYKLQSKNFDKSTLESWVTEFTKEVKNDEVTISVLEEKRTIISDFLTEAQRKLDDLETLIEKTRENKAIWFKENPKFFSEVRFHLDQAKKFYHRLMNTNQERFLVSSEHIRYKKSAIAEYKFALRELESRRQFDIWKRSPRALSLDAFLKALYDVEGILLAFFWRLPAVLNPFTLLRFVNAFSWQDYVGIVCYILYFLIFFFAFGHALLLLRSFLRKHTHGGYSALTNFILLVKLSALEVVERYSTIFALWLFVLVDMHIDVKQYWGGFGDFATGLDRVYLSACFYITSVGFLVVFSRMFVDKLQTVNRENTFNFVPSSLEATYAFLLRVLLYATAILIPLRQAFMYLVEGESRFPAVVYAFYIFILQVVFILLLFVHKKEIFGFLDFFKNRFVVWTVGILDKHYYVALIFVLCLLTLWNPYVGYTNLAFLLLYAVPLSLLIVYGVLYAHAYVRNSSAQWFIIEEDDEVIDRFDHAKTYYGLFVVLTFILFIFAALFLLAKIWQIPSAWGTLVDIIENKFTIDIGAEKRFGLVQVVVLTLFIAGGFLFSTLFDKYILGRSFDILRLDFGVRNTVSSLLHYIIIYVVLVLGLTTVHLGGFVFWISSAAIVGIGLAAKDFLADLIAGFLLLLERPVEIGSFIETDTLIGTVVKISARSTTLRTATHKFIILPNTKLLNIPITNWTYGRSYVGFDLEVLVSYKNDPAHVKEVVSAIIQADHRILRNPSTIYRVDEFMDSGFNFQIRTFISARRAREKWDIASDIRKAIMKRFAEEGIVIPFPQTVTHFGRAGILNTEKSGSAKVSISIGRSDDSSDDGSGQGSKES